MKSQWKIYRELELIPESVVQAKPHFLAYLFRPIRRTLARSFVKDLSHKHRILLFERCLGLDKAGNFSKKRRVDLAAAPVLESTKPSKHRVIAPFHGRRVQQGPHRGGLSWWGWSDQ